MRLYYRHTGTEITGVQIDYARRVANTGGDFIASLRDINLANIATMKTLMGQQVEIRKNDGSTVIWEGVIETIPRYNSQGAQFQGNEPLKILYDCNCKYNIIKAEGTVTSLADDYIMDTELTTDVSMVDKVVGYENVVGTYHANYFPNSNTDFFNGGVAAETETGTFADLATGGTSAMYMYDSNPRAKDYYGIDVKIDIANYATATFIIIALDFKVANRGEYTNTNEPLIQIYDFDGAAWVDTDNADISGVGRLDATATDWGRIENTCYRHHVTVKNNITNYCDTDELYIQVTCGSTFTDVDQLKLFTARATSYARGNQTANATGYTVDAVDTNKLTFTGQTPNADGVGVNMTYRMGEFLHEAADNFFKYAPITFVDIDFDTTTLFEAVDRRTASIGSTLIDYAKRLNRILYGKIGWEIECKTSLVDTGIDLDENDCVDWHLSVGSENTFSEIAAAVSRNVHRLGMYNTGKYTMRDEILPLPDLNLESVAELMLPTLVTRHTDYTITLTIRVDLDEGAPSVAGAWADLDLGKTIDIDLYSQLVITAGTIMEIRYMQEQNGHLFADILIEV